MTTATQTTADAFVARLLATDDADKRRALIDRQPLAKSDASEVIRRLLDEAESLIGADPRRMEQVCTDALTLATQVGDDFLWAMARFKQGEACTLQDRNAEACGYLDEAQAAFLRIGRPVEAARTRIPWVWAVANLGGDRAALAAGRAARRIFLAHGENLYRATLDLHVGILHSMRARYNAGVRCFRLALSVYESLGETARAARARHNLALALSRLGRFREALAEFERAAEEARISGQNLGFAVLRRSVGETQMYLGRYAAALQSFDEARPLFRSLDLHAGSVWLARDTADCYLRLNRPADALAALAEADEALARVDRATDVYAIAARRAAAHLLLGHRQAALSALDAAAASEVAADRHDIAWLATLRAALQLREGALQEAYEGASKALIHARAAGVPRLTADALLVQGATALVLERPDVAERLARRSYRLARSQDAAPQMHRALELLGRVAEARQNAAAARRYYRDAIRQLEREQAGVIFEFRDSFAADRGLAYERLAGLQLRAGRHVAALATAERAKSRALADAISDGVSLTPRGTSAVRKFARDLARAREDYAALFAWTNRDADGTPAPAAEREEHHRTLTDLEARITDLVRRLQLAGAGDEVADLYGATPSATLPAVAPHTTLIEFFFNGEDILRFVVDAGGVRGTTLAGAVPEVDRLIRVFRLNLEAAEYAAPDARARLDDQAQVVLRRLHARLLGDLVIRRDCRLIVVVPHGVLHYLPFHALHDGERYLVERFAVSYAPSATLYAICRGRTRPSGRRRALVLAHSRNGCLPHTLEEAAAVGATLGVSVHQESAATRTLLQAAGRRAPIIHIAAHGRFRPDAPLFSHVELADGPLTTTDAFGLDLPGALVTLSACETGRAVLGGGDELIGLTRAFLYAGAARLLVSHWRVEDGSTAALMTRFYEELRGTSDHAEALRTAQVAAIHADGDATRRGHPFFWAGFQMIGAA